MSDYLKETVIWDFGALKGSLKRAIDDLKSILILVDETYEHFKSLDKDKEE